MNEAHRKNISIALKGKQKGKTYQDIYGDRAQEECLKRSIALRGRAVCKMTDATKKKIALAHLGKPQSIFSN
jgi:hypothetical protein